MERTAPERRPLLPAALLLLSLHVLLPPSQARAEAYLDLFAGQSRSSSDNVKVTNRSWGIFGGSSEQTASREESFSPGALLGGRIRVFHPKALWLGGAGEFSYYRARGEHVSVDAIPFSLQLHLRAPFFPHPDYAAGRLHLYAGGGVSLVLYQTKADLRPEVPREVSAWSTGAGFTGLAGAAVALSPRAFLFVEGRASSLDASVDTGEDGFALFSDDEAEVELHSTQLLVGISWRIDAGAPSRTATSPPPPGAGPDAGAPPPPAP